MHLRCNLIKSFLEILSLDGLFLPVSLQESVEKLLKICVLKARRDAGSALNLDLKEMRSCLPLRPVSASSSVLLSCVDSKHLICIPAFFCYYLHGRNIFLCWFLFVRSIMLFQFPMRFIS